MPTATFDERRSERRVAIAALFGGVVFAVLALRPNPAEQSARELVRIGLLERQALTAFRTILVEAQAGRLKEPAAADRIEREVLIPWRQARRRIELARSGPLAAYFPEEMPDYFRLRQESWEAFIAGVRTQDADLIARHRNLWQDGDRAAIALRAALVPVGTRPPKAD